MPKIIILNQIFIYYLNLFNLQKSRKNRKIIFAPYFNRGFFWEGYPMGTHAKNHNSKSNISIFFLIYLIYRNLEKIEKLFLPFISIRGHFFGGVTQWVLMPKIITLNQIFLFFLISGFFQISKKKS